MRLISLPLLTLPLLLAACPGGGDDDAAAGAAAGDHFFLPTGDEARNTVNPTIETGRDGRIHMVYPAYAIGDAFYATCVSDCADPAQVKVVRFATDGTVADAMLALGADGQPQVLLATFQDVYYGRCTGDCTTRAGWSLDRILHHDGNLEVTGEAFALAPGDLPRFMMHSYRPFLIGAPPPETFYVTCDAGCSQPASWSRHKVADQVWQETYLRFTPDGHPRVATVATTETGELAGYMACDADCTDGASWTGTA
jgi:hypothetical protein